MESTMSRSLVTTHSLNPLIFRLHCQLARVPLQRQSFPGRLIAHRLNCIYNDGLHRSRFASLPSPSLGSRCPAILRSTGHPLRCIGNTSYPFASSGGTGGFGGERGGGGGGGGNGSGGGDERSKSAATGAGGEEASALSSDVIILDVGGMTCGGCAASVKRILESQPQVSSASVNLTTETAIVWPISEAKVVPNWQKELGEALAKHLTTCGFTSTLRGQEAIEGDVIP